MLELKTNLQKSLKSALAFPRLDIRDDSLTWLVWQSGVQLRLSTWAPITGLSMWFELLIAQSWFPQSKQAFQDTQRKAASLLVTHPWKSQNVPSVTFCWLIKSLRPTQTLWCRVRLHLLLGNILYRRVRDPGLIPGSGRSPGEGNVNPFQYSCLENSMDRGAWWAI